MHGLATVGIKRQLHDLAARIHDDLTLVSQRDARVIRGEIDEPTGKLVVRCRELHPDPVGDKPDLGVDPGYRLASAATALTRLRRTLSDAGQPWWGRSIELVRLPDGASVLRLLGEGGRAGIKLVVAADDPAVMVPELLFEVALATERRLGPPAQLIVEPPPRASARLDMDRGELRVGGESTARVNVVGRYTPADGRMRWAFADDSIDARRSAAARRASDAFRRLGLHAFTVPELACEPGFAWALARMAAHRAGSRASLALPGAECTYFLAFL